MRTKNETIVLKIGADGTRHERWRAQWKLNWRLEQLTRGMVQMGRAARRAGVSLGWLAIPPPMVLRWPFPTFASYRRRPFDWAFDLPKKELHDG